MVSAGEVHLPGRPRDIVGLKALAITAQRAFDNFRPGGVKVLAGAPVILLGEGERPRVQRVRELLVVLGDHARAAARGAVQRHELDVQQRGDLRHRAVQLRREPTAHAAGPVCDLHVFGLLSTGVLPAALPSSGCGSSSSPTTYRLSS